MKAVLEFNLDDEDDSRALIRCNKALDMALALWEIRFELKRKLKYIERTEEEQDIIDDLFSTIIEIIHERGIVLDDMIV